MKREGVKANYIYNMTYQILNILLPLITTPYISRVLGADLIGVYSYTYSIISTFVMVGSLGIGTYGQREIAMVNSEPAKMSVVFWEIQWVKTISVLCSLFILLIFAAFSGEYQVYLLIQIPYFVAAILDISWLYQGLENFKLVAIRNIIIKLAGLGLIFGLVKTKDDLISYMLILCVSQVVGNLVMWFSLPKILKKVKIQLRDLCKHIKPTFVYFVPTVSYQIYAVLDKAMLGAIYSDKAESGYYEQAHKLINMLTLVVSSYTIVMRSRMTVYFSQMNLDKIHESFRNSMHFICAMVFPMSFGLAAVANNIVPWFFGEGYERVTVLLYCFAPYFVFMGVCTGIGTHILTPSGQQKKSNVGQCMAAIINVILNAILIRYYGAVGATISSVVAEAIIVIAYMHYIKKYMTYRELAGISYKYCIAAVVMFVPTILLSKQMETSIVSTLLCVIVGALVYSIMLIILRAPLIVTAMEMIKRKIFLKRRK